ncbi:unnamed protein product [Adineta ricciae]|uniref:HAT C-terminal dimerisation domain-containing protein n=1 Tax=Adineta ricciae TaxID=249248 RepID=A0A815ASB2_ADIRI|nr:unnamed protein product [Adineta ricciae]
MQVVPLPTTTTASAFDRLKQFRRKCGIIDDPSDIVGHKDLSLRQEFANFEAYKKDDFSFSTFWRKYGSSLPKLNTMACRYGTISGTSVPSESLFSIAGIFESIFEVLNDERGSLYRCEASTKELARTNDMLAKNFFTKYVPSMRTTPFDSEFNSASNGDTFIRRTNFGKILSGL